MRCAHLCIPQNMHIVQIFRIFIYLIIIVHGSVNVSEELSCYLQESIDNYAAILPKDAIYQEVNSTFTVSCLLDPTHGLISTEIYFSDIFGCNVDIETMVTNDLTIRAKMRGTEPCKSCLICRSSDKILAVQEIHVGYPPLNVLNFDCKSFNWQTLVCAYDLPQNTAQRSEDDYFLSYSAELEGTDFTEGYKCLDSNLKNCCPLQGDECWKWGASAYYPYEKFTQFQYFKIFSENPLGNKSFLYELNLFEKMVPDPVERLHVWPIGPRMINVEFELPVFLSLFPPGITYRVHASSTYDEHYYLNTTFDQWNVTVAMDVPWPGQTYKVDVTLRSGNNSWNPDDGEDGWWSRNYPLDVTVTTPSLPPWKAPEVAPGLFQTYSKTGEIRSIIVAWKQMKKYFHGGRDFRYKIETFADDVKLNEMPRQITNTFAEFEHLSSDIRYRFVITPVNEAGIGNSSAEIIVDKEAKIPVDLFFPLVIDHEIKKIVELRWFSSDADLFATNYTLFICNDSSAELERPCENTLNWKHLENVTSVNFTYDELGAMKSFGNLRFAFANRALEGGGQTGMTWASCPLMDDEGTQSSPVSAPLVVHTTSTGATVTWALSCAHWRSYPVEIEIIWCMGANQNINECSDQNLNGVFNSLKSQPWPQKIVLEDLEPDSSYTIWVKVFYRKGIEQLSSASNFTTEPLRMNKFRIFLLVSGSLVSTFVVILVATYGKRRIISTWKEAKADINMPEGMRHPKTSKREFSDNIKHQEELTTNPVANESYDRQIPEKEQKVNSASYRDNLPCLKSNLTNREVVISSLEDCVALNYSPKEEVFLSTSKEKKFISFSDNSDLDFLSFELKDLSAREPLLKHGPILKRVTPDFARETQTPQIYHGSFKTATVESGTKIVQQPSPGYVLAVSPTTFITQVSIDAKEVDLNSVNENNYSKSNFKPYVPFETANNLSSYSCNDNSEVKREFSLSSHSEPQNSAVIAAKLSEYDEVLNLPSSLRVANIPVLPIRHGQAAEGICAYVPSYNVHEENSAIPPPGYVLAHEFS